MQLTWRYRFYPEFMRAERNPSYYVRFHLPLLVVFSALCFLPAVQQWTGMRPVPVAILLALQLAMYGTYVFWSATERHPVAWSGFALLVNLTVSAGIPATVADPRSLMWLLYWVYVAMVSQAGRPTVTSAAAVALAPYGVVLWWDQASMVRWQEAIGGLTALSIASTLGYLFLGRVGLLQREARLHVQRLEEEAAQAGERRRIARDLHDTLGAALAEVSLWQDVAAGADPSRAPDALARARVRMRDAVEELRACVGSLDAADLPSDSLEQLLASRLSGLCEAAGVALELKVRQGRSVPVATLHHLLKAVSEAVSNAVRHANAGRVCVEIDAREALTIEVRDDGSGFDLSLPSGGTGLRSMRDRAQRLGGTFEVTSSSAGTRLVWRVPLERAPVRLTA